VLWLPGSLLDDLALAQTDRETVAIGRFHVELRWHCWLRGLRLAAEPERRPLFIAAFQVNQFP
jgi:hypothetical protein